MRKVYVYRTLIYSDVLLKNQRVYTPLVHTWDSLDPIIEIKKKILFKK